MSSATLVRKNPSVRVDGECHLLPSSKRTLWCSLMANVICYPGQKEPFVAGWWQMSFATLVRKNPFVQVDGECHHLPWSEITLWLRLMVNFICCPGQKEPLGAGWWRMSSATLVRKNPWVQGDGEYPLPPKLPSARDDIPWIQWEFCKKLLMNLPTLFMQVWWHQIH